MKSLNLLTVFTRPSTFAAAMSVAMVLAFVSSASAGEKNFDALGGVTAEALTPAAMDAIQGMGSIRVGFINVNHPFLRVDKATGGPWDIVVHLERRGKGKVTRTRVAD